MSSLENYYFQVKNESSSLEKLSLAKPELAEEIKNAKAVILPSHGSKDSFYSSTLDLLDYLNENGLCTTVYASDDEYIELSLHGADHWIGKLFINEVTIPLFVGLLTNYVYDELKAEPDDNIAINVVVERGSDNSISVDFRGKVDDLTLALNEINKLGVADNKEEKKEANESLNEKK
ncbi:hypothetical protein [Vibrio campbellii]|uniref:hypothetical protein n=1 Tax=Vibrio campbellii TaxID=680 RepID=UPI0005770E66|nr:hypothetical protein [Vibrio campbellii]